MSRETYHTEGVILSYIDIGESERLYFIYTKNFGLIKIFAQGIRLSKSKLAPHMGLFSHSRISFVYGKDIFRLIDAEIISQFAFDGASFEKAGSVIKFLRRVVQGQEPDEPVWQLVYSAFSFLSSGALADRTGKEFETLFAARLLHRLGYVGNMPPAIAHAVVQNGWGVVQEKMAEENFFPHLRALAQSGLRISQL